MSNISNTKQVRILTDNICENPISVEDYVKSGGFSALKKAITMKSEDIIDEVLKAKLLGRGGISGREKMGAFGARSVINKIHSLQRR